MQLGPHFGIDTNSLPHESDLGAEAEAGGASGFSAGSSRRGLLARPLSYDSRFSLVFFSSELELVETALEHVLPPVTLVSCLSKLGFGLGERRQLGAELGLDRAAHLTRLLLGLELLKTASEELLDDLELADPGLEGRVRSDELLVGLRYVVAVDRGTSTTRGRAGDAESRRDWDWNCGSSMPWNMAIP